jgi:1,3-beta-glucanosyltransferase GAS5
VLFSDRFRNEFVGGVVFEYSTEKINSLAPYPFDQYGEGNFGLGYLTPEDCDDVSIPCQFTPFPQFSVLAAKYGAVDTTAEPMMSDDVAIDQQQPPSCPVQFPPLQSYEWPTSATSDRECPGQVYINCPSVPDECDGLGIPFQPVATGTNLTASPGSLGSASPTPGIGVTIPSSQSPAGVSARPTAFPSTTRASKRAPSQPPKKFTTVPPTVPTDVSGSNTHGSLARALHCLIVCTLILFV